MVCHFSLAVVTHSKDFEFFKLLLFILFHSFFLFFLFILVGLRSLFLLLFLAWLTIHTIHTFGAGYTSHSCFGLFFALIITIKIFIFDVEIWSSLFTNTLLRPLNFSFSLTCEFLNFDIFRHFFVLFRIDWEISPVFNRFLLNSIRRILALRYFALIIIPFWMFLIIILDHLSDIGQIFDWFPSRLLNRESNPLDVIFNFVIIDPSIEDFLDLVLIGHCL